MEFTRLEHKKLVTAVDKAEGKIDEALAIVSSVLVHLTNEHRQGLLRPPTTFPKAGYALSRVMVEHKDVAALTEFDPEAVTEDLDNAASLDSLEQKLERFSQLVADSRLLWLAEAYVPSLGAYNVAKVAAKNDPALSEVIKPLAAVFGSRRTPPKPSK